MQEEVVLFCSLLVLPIALKPLVLPLPASFSSNRTQASGFASGFVLRHCQETNFIPALSIHCDRI
jgi:hypothetical protein